VELRHLRYFIAVADAKSVTRAAAALGLQQPPLSQQVKALERELGFALFKRHPKGVELTPGGEVFLREARETFANLGRAATRASRASQGLVGSLSVGLTSSALAHPFAPRLLREFVRAYPNVDLGLKEGNAADLSEAVAKRTVDAALIRSPVSHPSGIVFEELVREEMLAVLPRGHAAAKGAGSLSLKALRDDGFILVRRPGAPGLYAQLIEACNREGFSPRIVAEVANMVTNVTLVAAGMGVSAVPASMRDFHRGSVVYRRLRPSSRLYAPVTLTTRRDASNPVAKRLATLARELARAAA